MSKKFVQEPLLKQLTVVCTLGYSRSKCEKKRERVCAANGLTGREAVKAYWNS